MDSKYSIFSKNKPNQSNTSPFSQNMKRKFAYSSPSLLPPTKKPNLQNTPKLSNPSQNSPQNGSTMVFNKSSDIQKQRKQLPVYAVREQ